jgi:hypothetical protein
VPGNTVYLVQRLHWQFNDSTYDFKRHEPVRAFRTRERAEAHRRELESEARREAEEFDSSRGPGKFEMPFDPPSSLSEEELVARLAEMGLGPPEERYPGAPTIYDWSDRDWWEGCLAHLPDEQHDRLWDLFDRQRFYEVVELELPSEPTEGPP